MPRVIAYYTKGPRYAQLIEKLKQSCAQFDIPIKARAFLGRGSWEENCAIKPEFILEMLKKFPGETLIYIDADATIKKNPELFFIFDMDFACHYRRGKELLSGTLIFNSNDRTIAFVEAWVQAQKAEPKKWDQKVLQEVLESWDQDLEVYELPATYCKIFDAHDQKGEPVIEHSQASRAVKRERKLGKSKLPSRARQQPDGSVILLHRRPEQVKFMDQHFKRRHPNEERWIPDLKSVSDAELDFNGKIGYVIGKGPSLDKLSPDDFPDDGPVIAINEASFKLDQLDIPNPTFLVQDPSLGQFARPTKVTVILEQNICGFYLNYPRKLQYSRDGMELPKGVLSAIVAIRLLRSWNVSRIEMVAFDACVNKDTRYAEAVGYASDKYRPAKRFLNHKPQLVKNLADMDYNFRLAGITQ